MINQADVKSVFEDPTSIVCHPHLHIPNQSNQLQGGGVAYILGQRELDQELLPVRKDLYLDIVNFNDSFSFVYSNI